MTNSSNGLILWVLGGTGVFLLMASITNRTPESLLLSYLGQGTAEPISTWGASGTTAAPSRPKAKSFIGSNDKKVYTGGADTDGTVAGTGLGGALVSYDKNGNNVYADSPGTYLNA
jgi:hypothetical protein